MKLERFLTFFNTRTPLGGLLRYLKGTMHPLTHLTPFAPQELFIQKYIGLQKNSLQQALTFDVVCTTLNEENSIQDLLDDIASQVIQPKKVFIVDGGSSDNTIALIQRYQSLDINLIVEPGASIAKARNIGILSSKSPYVLFVDAGCRYKSDFSQNMIQTLADYNLQYVGSSYYSTDPEGNIIKSDPHVPVWKKRKLGHFLPSARGLLIEKQLINSVGGFPEFLTRAGEDTLWAVWLRNNAKRFGIQTKSPVAWCVSTNPVHIQKRANDYFMGDQESRYSDWLNSKKPFASHPSPNFLEISKLREKVDSRRGLKNANLLITDGLLGTKKSLLDKESFSVLFNSNSLIISISIHHQWWSCHKRNLFRWDLSKFEAHSLLCANECIPAIRINGVVENVFFESSKTIKRWNNLIAKNKIGKEILEITKNSCFLTLDETKFPKDSTI